MNKTALTLTALFLLLFWTCGPAYCFQLKSRYATVHYSSKKLLRDFNDELYMPRSLSRSVRRRSVVLLEDEVLAKVDVIIEKAESVLDMFPNKFHVNIVLLPTRRDVAKVFKEKYGKKVKHIAYYSLSEKTIYISVNNTSIRVLAHEIGHAIVDHYFKVRPPYNIHELLAQFTEKHITD